MARPKKTRMLNYKIRENHFRPRGVNLAGMEVADLKGDELEAMRLCFLERREHFDAAREMRVSRRTLERILFSGRAKVTDALLHGKGINITFPEYVSFKKERR